MITHVYLDLDDVMADFLDHYYNTFGVRWHELENVHDRWNNINHMPGWFANLPFKECYDAALGFWSNLSSLCYIKHIDLKILTATGWRYEPVSVEKKVWCWKMLQIPPDKVITVDNRRKKKEFATPTSILIDDSQDNIIEWAEAGGIAILHTSFDESWSHIDKILGA